MAIYKRYDSEFWWINIYRGKHLPRLQVSSKSADEGEARAIEAAMRQAIRGNAKRAYLSKVLDAWASDEALAMRVLLKKALDTYVAQPNVDLAPNGLRGVRSHVTQFLAWCGKHHPQVAYMDEISRAIAHEYADHLLSKELAGKTYNNHRGSLSAVWQVLAYRAGTAENVWRLIPTASERHARKRRPFTRDEERRILENCSVVSGDWFGVCLVARYTGLRQGDAAWLQWSHIVGDMLEIEPSKTTRHKIRVRMPLHRRVLEHLESLPRESEWVFPRVRMRHKKKRAYEDFAAILKAAGVSDDKAIVDFHSWRHTWRTRFSEAGGSPDDAKIAGGWTTDEMQRHYNHDLSGIRRAIEAMD